MTRPLLTILSLLAAGSAFGQTVLLNTRLHPSEYLTLEQTTLQLDLQDFFQTYEAPGPVATLTIRKPVQEGWRTFNVDGEEAEFMSYKLAASGASYDSPYAVSPADFEWTEHTVEYQLFGDEAPVTVANFKTYADDGIYTNTIVHRNESTGRIFSVNGPTTYSPLPILQTGGFRIYETEKYLLEWIPTRPPIVFEQTRNNVQGTIAMARTDSLNSATSQFFINLEDNTNQFGSAYSVFGELIDPENDQPVLDDFARTDTYDLSSPRNPSEQNIFPRLPFETLPLYSPAWQDKSSYVRISSISVADGDPAGITYSSAFVDIDGEEGTSEEEAANQASFDIQIDGSQLSIERTDTAFAVVEVTGTNGAGETASFTVQLVAFNPDALDRYPTAAIRQGGNLESDWYGTFYADTYPHIVHPNHGKQYVQSYESKDEESGAVSEIPFYYDYALESYLYFTPGNYPRMYVYSLGKWVEYAEGTGNGDDVPRWFYLFDGDNAGWVSETEL